MSYGGSNSGIPNLRAYRRAGFSAHDQSPETSIPDEPQDAPAIHDSVRDNWPVPFRGMPGEHPIHSPATNQSRRHSEPERNQPASGEGTRNPGAPVAVSYGSSPPKPATGSVAAHQRRPGEI